MLAAHDSRLPAFALLEVLIIFFFTPMSTSPFIYFQF